MTNTEIISYAAMAILFWAVWDLSKGNTRRGNILNVASSILWSVVAVDTHMWSLLIMEVGIIGIVLRTYLKPIVKILKVIP